MYFILDILTVFISKKKWHWQHSLLYHLPSRGKKFTRQKQLDIHSSIFSVSFIFEVPWHFFNRREHIYIYIYIYCWHTYMLIFKSFKLMWHHAGVFWLWYFYTWSSLQSESPSKYLCFVLTLSSLNRTMLFFFKNCFYI